MERRIAICLTIILYSIGGASAQTPAVVKDRSFSIGVDLVSISYGQVLVYFEKPILDNLSIDIALGYSPSGKWNSSFSYWYLQTDFRNYLEGSVQDGFYTEFGAAVYLADRKLQFTNWNITPSFDTSVVFGATGGVGYKYFLPSADGFYVDSNAFIYGLVPEPILATKSQEFAVFQYSPFNILGSVIAGFNF